MKLLTVLAVFLCMGAPFQGFVRNGFVTAENYRNLTHFDSRIIDGWPTDKIKFPYLGYIDTYPCGAVLIEKNWALTTAHCVTKHYAINIYFRGRQVHRVVKEKVIHPDYDEQLVHNNVALLSFDPVPFGPTIQPIQIDRTNDLHVDRDAFVCGFGRTKRDGDLSDHLWYTRLTVITNYICKKIYGKVVIDSTLCASPTSTEGIAHGDTGGPLVLRGPEPENGALLIGIASFWHIEGPDKGYPSGFTRINRFTTWIDLITVS